MTALEKFQVSFAKLDRFNGRIKVRSVNDCFSSFLGEHKTVSAATRLLNGINAAINQNLQNPQWGFPTQGMIIAVVDASNTKVYGDLEEYAADKSILPAFTLPTSDFKQIVEAWLQFIQNNN